MADGPEATKKKGIRYYVGHVYERIASELEGHVHDVDADGTIDCADCATLAKLPEVGTAAADRAAANPELNPAPAKPASPAS